MASLAALKATKAFKTGAKSVKAVNKAGETLGTCQTYFTFGSSILSLFGIPSGPTLDDVLVKLDQMHTDMLAGFASIENRLDELQLSNSINELTNDIDFYYTRIQEICKDYSDPDARDFQLRQLLIKTYPNLTVINDVMQCVYDVKEIMLGEKSWTIGDIFKSVGDIIAEAEVEKAGDERFGYMSSAVQYYSYNLVYLYEGLFVVNFIEAYFDQSDATEDTPSPNVVRVLERINAVEDQSPLTTYQPYFEMRIFCARPPSGRSGDKEWVLFSSGEYMIYDLGTHAVNDGPYRLSSTLNPPPAGFRAIPPEFYYADGVYNHRTNPKLNKYDDYYYFIKGKEYTCLFWDSSTIKRSGTIDPKLPPKDGPVKIVDADVGAAMQNPGNNKCYFFKNEGSTIFYSYITDRNWYDVSTPTYSRKPAWEPLVDGGGGLPDERDKMVTFGGRYACKLYETSDRWYASQRMKVWEFLPAIAEKFWHIREMMDRDAPLFQE